MLNEHIERWCAEHGRNKAGFAAEVGTKPENLSRWIGRKAVPRVEMNKKLAEALGLDPLALWQWFKGKT